MKFAKLIAVVVAVSAARAGESPNVLFIAVDDLNNYISPLDHHPGIKTPNFDRLAERSVTFTNAHCAAPACHPSRVAVMTGVHPSTSGIYRNAFRAHGPRWRHESPVLGDAVVLSQHFRDHGYRAVGGGKIFHTLQWTPGDSQNDPNAWDDYRGDPLDPISADWPRPKLPADQNAGFVGKRPLGQHHFGAAAIIDRAEDTYGDHLVVDWAIEQMQAQREEPLFLAVGLFRPHIPWEVPQRWFDLYPIDEVELPAHRDDDLDDCHSHGREGWHQWVTDNDQWTHLMRGYLASISYVDHQVGRLLDALDASEMTENTIVVLWTDHGFHIGEKENWEKFSLWDQTTNVPLFIHAPGVSRDGEKCEQPATLTDLYPTLCELARLPTPQQCDGLSLVPQLRDPSAERSVAALTSYQFGGEPAASHAVCDDRYRFIRYGDGTEELYDLDLDPNEFDNRIDNVTPLRAVRNRLAAQLPKDPAKQVAIPTDSPFHRGKKPRAANGRPAAKPRSLASVEQRFEPPLMTSVPDKLAPFDYVDVGPKIPNYTPGAKWGTQEKPKTLMQRPLSPEESMQHYVTPVDFHLELYAAEGDLGGKPIAMNWDEHGRLWVCETVDYPNELQPQNRGRDRIRVCEDTDDDGKADKFTIFAENLSIPTSVCPWNDGVIVQNGTETLYLKDTDGDGKADMRHVLISNWELGDTHGGVSNLRFGLDNWIWGMQGYNNSAVVINGEQQLPFRMGFFRFKLDSSMPPKVSQLEFMRSTNNNTWGLGISEDGLIFGSTANHNPSTFMPIPNRYYEQVNGWTSDRLETIADTHLFHPITDKVRQVDHHGGYTAGAGHALYTARTYPDQWWNRTAFVAGPTGHLIGTFVLTPDGAGYTSTSPTNLVASDDEWAAPIMAEVGPDGNVWVLDWYNYIVQHNPTPQGFETGKGRAYVSDLRDKKYGRIYRVVYGDGGNDAPIASLKRDDVDSLIAGLSHSSMTVRLAAQRLLIEEQATAAIPELIERTKSSEVDSIGLNVAAIHALQTLRGLGALEGDSAAFDAAVAALKHRSPGVRRNAAQVLPPTDAARKALIASGILNDADAQAALAGVLALADMPSSDVGDKVIGLINGRVGSDRWLADAATSAAATHAVSFLKSLGGSADGFLNARMLPITRTVAEHFARSKPTGAEVDEVFIGLAGGESVLIAEVLSGFTAGWPKDHTVDLSKETDTQLAELFDAVPTEVQASLVQLASSLNSDSLLAKTTKIADSLLKKIRDVDLDTQARLAAAKNLVSLAPTSEDTLNALLDQIGGAASPDFSTSVLTAIGAMDPDLIAEPLAEMVSLATPAVREVAIQTLLARPQTTSVLLDSIEAGDVAPSDLSLVQRQMLSSLPNKGLRLRAEELMNKSGGSVNPDRQRVLDSKLFLTEQSGSVASGRVVYEKNCAACHVYRGLGKKVGPILDGMAVHRKKELLTHILDPNRNVEGNYRLYTVVTSDGMVLNGMLANETRTTIQIVDSKGESKSVLREEIEEIIPSRKSIMPEGFESNISDQGLVDLLTFLTDISHYLPVPLEQAANVISTRGMFYDRNGLRERIIFDDWDMKAFKGVPFRLIDPNGNSRPNMVMLRSPNGPLTQGLIESVRIPANTPAKAIHLLSGIGGWAARGPGDRGVAMVVRLIYADGQTEDHKLIDGQHFADYNGLFDVPQSERAFKTNGGNYQVRYIKIEPRRPDRIETIELAKGPARVAPIVAAITVEPR